ncbi:MAG: hypothetical protein AAF581_10190 [Planctomycetota bacterium]
MQRRRVACVLAAIIIASAVAFAWVKREALQNSWYTTFADRYLRSGSWYVEAASTGLADGDFQHGLATNWEFSDRGLLLRSGSFHVLLLSFRSSVGTLEVRSAESEPWRAYGLQFTSADTIRVVGAGYDYSLKRGFFDQ